MLGAIIRKAHVSFWYVGRSQEVCQCETSFVISEIRFLQQELFYWKGARGKKCAAFNLAGTLIRRATIEQIRKLGGTSTAFQKCCAAFSGGTKRRKSQRRVELLLSHWCWTLSLWHASGCATLPLLKGTQLNLTGTVGSGMDRTQVWAVWCFCILKYLHFLNIFFLRFYSLSSSEYQNPTISDIWEWSMQRITCSEFQQLSHRQKPWFPVSDGAACVHEGTSKQPPRRCMRIQATSTQSQSCVCVCVTHCDIVITAEPHSMKKNIVKWIKRANYLPLFLYSNISFMLS